MGVDKQKARRQRNIRLSVVCEEAADMPRDLVLRKIDYFRFVRTKTEKDNGY